MPPWTMGYSATKLPIVRLFIKVCCLLIKWFTVSEANHLRLTLFAGPVNHGFTERLPRLDGINRRGIENQVCQIYRGKRFVYMHLQWEN